MVAKYQYGGARAGLLAVILIVPCAGRVLAQTAPGNLPWGAPPSNNAPTSPQTNAESGSHLLPEITFGLFRHLYGAAYFGFDSVGSNSSRFNTDDYGFNLNSSGYFLDPRLWSQVMSVDLDHFGGGSGGASRGLGFRLDGTLLRTRSFPLRIIVVRRAADANSLGVGNHNGYHSLTLDWTLRQPKFANIGLSATFGGSSQETSQNIPFPVVPLRERDQSLTGQISRVIRGWSLTGAAYRTRVRIAPQDLQEVISGRQFEIERRLSLGQRGYFQTSFRHNQRSDSRRSSNPSFMAPSTSISLNWAQATLGYRHTEKLRGTYSVAYTSNLNEAAISAALLPSTGAGAGSPVQLDPGLTQALTSHNRSSSLGMNAGWTYNVTPRLYFGAIVGQTFLNTPPLLANIPPASNQIGLLKSYTSLGGSFGYRRNFGKWDTDWRASLTHHWDQRPRGPGFTEDSRSFGIDVSRRFHSWLWTSDLSYTDFVSGQTGARLYTEERWTNTLKTRLNPRITLDLGAEILHLDTNLTSLLLSNKSRDTALLLHGALTSRRWNLSGGTGLSNANSMAIALDLTNPLNTILLSQFTPLANTLNTADHYAELLGSYTPRHNLSFNGAYRRDNFQILAGEITRYSGMEFGVEYRLRKLTLQGGYQLQHQQTGTVKFDRNWIYVRIRRPFLIY
jgi:hypothetical protein